MSSIKLNVDGTMMDVYIPKINYNETTEKHEITVDPKKIKDDTYIFNPMGENTPIKQSVSKAFCHKMSFGADVIVCDEIFFEEENSKDELSKTQEK